MEVRYYICKHCGNIIEKVKDKGVPVICCGEPDAGIESRSDRCRSRKACTGIYD